MFGKFYIAPTEEPKTRTSHSKEKVMMKTVLEGACTHKTNMTSMHLVSTSPMNNGQIQFCYSKLIIRKRPICKTHTKVLFTSSRGSCRFLWAIPSTIILYQKSRKWTWKVQWATWWFGSHSYNALFKYSYTSQRPTPFWAHIILTLWTKIVSWAPWAFMCPYKHTGILLAKVRYGLVGELAECGVHSASSAAEFRTCSDMYL